jgi:acyl-CoA thioesterase-2
VEPPPRHRELTDVGDLAQDTAVVPVEADGRDGGLDGDVRHFTGRLSPEWAIWGPAGGYVASVALRAAGAASPFARPASFSCHFLGVGAFEEVDLTVRTLRAARTAWSQRVEMTQGGRPLLEATVWSVGEVDGLVHDTTFAPDVPGPAELRSVADLLADLPPDHVPARPPFPFWENFETRPLEFSVEPPTEPAEPVWRTWQRFDPEATFDDPWVDACRSLVLVDVQSWPSAVRQHYGRADQYIAPSLDLYVAFNDPQPASRWLLCDGNGPLARDGLMTWTGRLWSDGGALVASGGGQMLCRRLPPG